MRRIVSESSTMRTRVILMSTRAIVEPITHYIARVVCLAMSEQWLS
jgi:hypothetical protein